MLDILRKGLLLCFFFGGGGGGGRGFKVFSAASGDEMVEMANQLKKIDEDFSSDVILDTSKPCTCDLIYIPDQTTCLMPIYSNYWSRYKWQVHQNSLLLQRAGIVGGSAEVEEKDFSLPVNSQQGLLDLERQPFE